MLHHLFLAILSACQIDAGDCPVGCPKAFEEIAGVACFARPVQFKDPRRVIVFLPGMMAPSAWFDLEKFAASATSKGYAVVALRGERGLCNWSPEAKEQHCFPSGKDQLPQVGELLLRLGEALPESRSPRGIGPHTYSSQSPNCGGCSLGERAVRRSSSSRIPPGSSWSTRQTSTG